MSPGRYKIYYACKRCDRRSKRRDDFCKRCGPPRAHLVLGGRRRRTFNEAPTEREKLIKSQFRTIRVPYDEEASFDSDESIESLPPLSPSPERRAVSPYMRRRSLFPECDSSNEDEYDANTSKKASPYMHCFGKDEYGNPKPGPSGLKNKYELMFADVNQFAEMVSKRRSHFQADDFPNEGEEEGNQKGNQIDSRRTPRNIEHGLDEDNDDGDPKPGPSGLKAVKSKFELKLSDESQFSERTVKKRISFLERIGKTPTNTDFTTDIPFSELKEAVSDLTLKAIADCGWEKMTETQARLIPEMLEGRDVTYQVKEWKSGKMVASLIHAVELMANGKLLHEKCTGVIIIIHELSEGVHVMSILKQLLRYYPTIRYGLVSSDSNRQLEVESLARGVHILIATPGRLLYHLKNTPEFLFGNLKCLIVDMAHSYYDPDIRGLVEKIINVLPKRQTVIFSAMRELSYELGLVQYQFDSSTLPPCRICGKVLTRNMFPDDQAFLVHAHCVIKPGEPEASTMAQEFKPDDEHSKSSYNQ